MRQRLGFFFLMMAVMALGPAVFAAQDPLELIRVRLDRGLNQITLTGIGLRVQGLVQNADDMRLSRWDISWDATRRGWFVQEREAGGQRRFLAGSRLEIRGQSLRSSRASYPDRLRLIAGRGSFDVVGEVNLREYLIGVVGHEMPPGWPLETLKAQAVAARSYTLAVRASRLKQDFHVESTVADQVFQHAPEREKEFRAVREAVVATDGQVLRTAQGQLLKAYYHADCGGRTAHSSRVWKAGPDTGTAVDESCPVSPRAQWELKVSLQDVSKRLSKLLGGLRVVSLSAVPDLLDSRIGEVRLKTAGGERRLDANQFRLALGAQDLRSTNFEVKETGGWLEFRGRGFGHGVGLCQWGSRALGLKGWDAGKILAHYYPKARLAD